LLNYNLWNQYLMTLYHTHTHTQFSSIVNFLLSYVLDNGKLEAPLRGIVTSRDVDFLGEESLDKPLNDVSGSGCGSSLSSVLCKSRDSHVTCCDVADDPS